MLYTHRDAAVLQQVFECLRGEQQHLHQAGHIPDSSVWTIQAALSQVSLTMIQLQPEPLSCINACLCSRT